MSSTDQELDDRPEDETAPENVEGSEGDETLEGEEKQPLKLDVKVEERSACERHVVVSVDREDVDRYFSEKVDELMPEAEVPGFRPGRAPRKLVENRFRRQLRDQVKGSLLLDAMTQVTDGDDFSAISEPDFDFDAVEIPDEGPFTFEFDIEVRPEFDLPKWEGLAIERPAREFTDEDVNKQINRLLESDADLVPHDGPAEAGDHVVVKITAKIDGKTVAACDEETICIRSNVSFPDANLEEFDKLMVGAKSGDVKEAKVSISDESDNEELRGKEVNLTFEVLDVKRVEDVELTDEILSRLGGFGSADELKELIRNELDRQLRYEQNQRVRDQISSLLTESADWDLPPELLKRQSGRELERAVLELRRSGFPEAQIRAYENDLRQNSLRRTERALKEHFILERIAEELELDASDDDFEQELALIAAQQRDSVRRVRASLEKRGQMDALRNQIVENKVIDLILEKAKISEVPYDVAQDDTSAVDFYLSGAEKPSHIPEAKYASEPEALPKTTERD